MRSALLQWTQALVLGALGLQFIEVMVLAGEEHWIGSASTKLSSLLISVAIYFVVLSFSSAVVGIPVYFVRGRKQPLWISVVVYLVTLVLGGVLYFTNDVAPLPAAVAVGALPLITLLATLVAIRLGRTAVPALPTVGIVAVGGAILMANESAYALLESPIRKYIVSFLTLAALIFTFVAGGIGSLWLHARYEKGRISIAGVLVLALIPPLAARIYADYGGLLRPGEGTKFLLISADTLRADYLSVYGGDVAVPNLERLAARGTVFEHCDALSSWTVPSLCGMMSSKYPPSTAADASREEWTADATRGYRHMAAYWLNSRGVTYLSDLTNLGVPTAMFMANFTMLYQNWLGDSFGFVRYTETDVPHRTGLMRNQPLLHALVRRLAPQFAPQRVPDSTELTREYAKAFVRQYHRQPFFLWAHFMDPHSPYTPPARYREEGLEYTKFPPADVEDAMGRSWAVAEKDAAQALYRGEIRYVDEAVGRLLDLLETLGVDDDTIVCFTSDHGEEFWDHGEWGHGHTLYRELVRVPLIVAGPDIAEQVIRTPVSAIHVLPTIADSFGTEPRTEWRGATILDALRDPDVSLLEEPRFAGATFPFGILKNPEPLEMVAWQGYKLIEGLRTGRIELYDIENDPGEQHNVADNHPKIVEEYRGLLAEWRTTYPNPARELWSWKADDAAKEETLDVFEALGYLN